MAVDELRVAKAIKFALNSTNDMGLSPVGLLATAGMDGLAKELGRDVAQALAKRADGSAYRALALYWRESGLGDMEVTEGRQTLIRLSNCYQCHALKNDDPRPTCEFKRKILESALERTVPTLQAVVERKCCRTGGVSCTFSVVVSRADAKAAADPPRSSP